MKKNCKVLAFVSLLPFVATISGLAQNRVPSNHKIMMEAAEGLQRWGLKLSAAAGAEVWIDWNGDGVFQSGEEVTAVSNEKITHDVSASRISIYGELTKFDCSYNSLVSLSVEDQPRMTSLNCGNNQLSHLAVTPMPVLKELFVYANKLDGASINTLVDLLPDYSQEQEPGDFYVYDSFSGDENICTKGAVAKAMAKGWRVLDYRSGQNPRPYQGIEDPAAKYNTNLPYIELTRENEEDWAMSAELNYENAPVAWVDWNLDGRYEKGEEVEDAESITHSVVSKTIRLYGAYNMLNVAFNSIVGVKLDRQTLLSQFYCQGNHLSAQTIDNIVSQLPDWSKSEDQGGFYVYYSGEEQPKEQNVCPKSVVAKLKSKGWSCMKIDDDEESELYEGTDEVVENPYTVDQPSIMLKRAVAEGEWKIALDITPEYMTSAWIDWNGDNTYQQGEEVSTTDVIKRAAEGESLKIYGTVKELVCTDNHIVSVVPEKQTILTSLQCQRNEMSNEAFFVLLNNLPDYAQSPTKGSLVVFDSKAPNDADKNSCYKNAIEKAVQLGWKVYDFNGDKNQMISYAGFEQASPELSANALRVRVCSTGNQLLMIVSDGLLRKHYAVYDLAGKLLVSGKIASPVTLLPSLAPGAYLMKAGSIVTKIQL